MDKAGQEYWESVWDTKQTIEKMDISYYTHKLLHSLYGKYLNFDKDKTICEIGCSMSQNLLYFHDNFGYQINGIDYDKKSALKTKIIYQNMGYESNIYHRDFFDNTHFPKYDILVSFGVFEHFENLDKSIKHTLNYINEGGTIITMIPNMNGIVGFLQKMLNKKVYDIHIPYTKEEILEAHEINGYKTLFCDYYGLYQGGVINISGVKYENIIRKILAIPGKPIYFINRLLNIRTDCKYISPYIIYIGKKS